MVDERAAVAISGLPAVATTTPGAMAPPPVPVPSPRPPPILVPPVNGNGSAGPAGHNGTSAGIGGIDGTGGGSGSLAHARTGDQEMSAPQPSPRTKRFTPVRALHVGTPPVLEGVAVTDASASSFGNSPRLGSSERLPGGAVSPTSGGPGSFGPSSPGRLAPPPLPHIISRRMSNIDRRVRSEALPPQKRHMSIASSRRPSILTGGYESSTDDDSKGEGKDKDQGAAPQPPHLRGPALLSHNHHHHSIPQFTAPPAGRRRAQSLLVTPRPHESWSLHPSTPPAASRRASRLSRPPATVSPFRSSAGGWTPTDQMSRTPSEALSLSQMSSRMGRTNSSGGRSREPSGGAADNEREDHRKVEQRRGNQLATSLGLAPSRPLILSPDQIENLLGSDADFSSAKARMVKPIRRQSSVTSNDGPQQQQQSLSTPPLSSSTFPPNPSSIAITPPPLSRPYLVTAPPPLTNGDWAGRDRATSVSSSVGTSNAAGTPLRNVTPHHSRRRALSTATLDSDGGHIPFTHHVHAVLPEDDDDIEEHEPKPEDMGETNESRVDGDRTATATPNDGGDTTPMPLSLLAADDSRQEHRTRRRISGLFGRRGKKRDSSPPPPATLTHVNAPTQPPTKKRAEAADRSRDRDAEMRRAELVRREEEQMEEQRYKALLLISAHPASQRRAQRAATHLDGYYAAVYQGLENPPKLNLLAVLRWKRKTDEQKQAREKWLREHADHTHLASPQHWVGGRSGPSSPTSDPMRSLSPRLIGSPQYFGSRSIASANSKPEQRAGRDWQYTLEDIQGYTESGGRVDFFIPPTIAPEPVERERAQSLSLHSEAQLSLPSAESPETREKEASVIATRLGSPSTPSLTQPMEVVENGSSAGDLSRRPSLEPGPTIRRRLPRHRSHQSTSGIPQPSRPIQTLRALGTGVKRNLAMAMYPGVPMTDNEDERRGAGTHPWHPTAVNDSPNNSPQPQISSHSLRDNRGLLGLRRAHERHERHDKDWAATSEDEHHHLRRYLPRRPPVFDRRGRRAVTTATGINPPLTRTEELHNLKQAIARSNEETTAEDRARLLQRELEDEERRREAEHNVYLVHESRLHEAQQLLANTDSAETTMSDVITHYLSQLDQVRGVFRTAADVEVKFEGLEKLSRPERRASDDELADTLSPLAAESDVNFSDRSRLRSPRSPRPRPLRRQASNVAAQSLPFFAYGVQAWPKRSTVDPTLGVEVNPFCRVELSCQKAEATVRDMEEQRASATRKIQEMVATVRSSIAQKDAVLGWVRDANNKILGLKRARGNKSQLVRGSLLETLIVLPGFDSLSDTLVRVFLGALSYSIRLYRLGTWARGRSYVAWSLVGAFIAMLAGFYYVGSTEIAVPLAPALVPTATSIATLSTISPPTATA